LSRARLFFFSFVWPSDLTLRASPSSLFAVFSWVVFGGGCATIFGLDFFSSLFGLSFTPLAFMLRNIFLETSSLFLFSSPLFPLPFSPIRTPVNALVYDLPPLNPSRNAFPFALLLFQLHRSAVVFPKERIGLYSETLPNCPFAPRSTSVPPLRPSAPQNNRTCHS